MSPALISFCLYSAELYSNVVVVVVVLFSFCVSFIKIRTNAFYIF